MLFKQSIFLLYIKTSLLSKTETDARLYFTFQECPAGYIELALNEVQQQSYNRWNVYPHIDPVVGMIDYNKSNLYSHILDLSSKC